MNRINYPEYDVNYISNCMSLRPPQKRSLKILDTILDEIELQKDVDVNNVLETVHDMFPTCSSFERDFFSIAFSLATGVGKTRLMGAFITYLYTVKGIKNFFIVAPNITIYNKLKKEFSDINHPKYVFKGLSCFAAIQPHMVYGDNYKNVGMTYGVSDCTINIFNIDKFNKQVGEMKKLSEFIGESYFEYLSNLPDLVLLMDESHHYRAEKGFQAINELNPILGLELTATPQVETGSKTLKFKNVVYEYPLSQAIKDGYTKIPYAMTRRDIGDLKFGDEDIDKLMISDGLLNHERVKVGLENYANLHPGERKVKPFMMIVCKDTSHAEKVLKFITSDDFENGKYKDKTIILHSNQTGVEKEENIQLLNQVERYENPIEIVIHVNILKEGWDVNNLYTIVPLRTAASKTLREQIIGRGLRLPYGKRVDDNIVDSLVIASHDKFEEIIKEANDPNSLLRAKNIIFAEEIEKENCVLSDSLLNQKLQVRIEECFSNIDNSTSYSEEEKNMLKEVAVKVNGLVVNSLKFNKTNQISKAEDIINEVVQDKDYAEIINSKTDFSDILKNWITEEVNNQNTIVQTNTIKIPIISVSDEGSDYYFEKFNLDLQYFNYVPISNDIEYKNLINNEAIYYKSKGIDFQALNPMSVLAIELKNKPEITEKDDDLLFDLISEFLMFLEKSYNHNDIKHIVMFNKRDISNKIYEQMKKHYVKKDCDLVERVIGVSLDPIPNSYKNTEGRDILSLYDNIEDGDVPKYIFSGFKRAIHKNYKFDSAPEKRLAIICESDNKVLKWMRPAPMQFKLFYNGTQRYIPDFVVETSEYNYLIEVKGEDRLNDKDVILKRNRAVKYCNVVNIYSDAHNYKQWKHLFIPAQEIKLTTSFESLCARFEYNEIVEE